MEGKTQIAVVDYGVNNVGSVVNALRRVGVVPYVATKGDELAAAKAIVLPGIGAFDTGVKNLRERGLFTALQERAAADVPVLGICLGMQLLSKGSEEGSLEGLSLVDAYTKRFDFAAERTDLKVPHMGWNETACRDTTLFDGLDAPDTRFYYVHSYHVVSADPSLVAATCNYGIEFTSAVRQKRVFGTQFHPEKSHRFGLRVFENYVRFVGNA